MGDLRGRVLTVDDVSPDLMQRLEIMIGQLPIVFANRASGELRIPISEINGTGDYMVNLEIDLVAGEIIFRSYKKS